MGCFFRVTKRNTKSANGSRAEQAHRLDCYHSIRFLASFCALGSFLHQRTELASAPQHYYLLISIQVKERLVSQPLLSVGITTFPRTSPLWLIFLKGMLSEINNQIYIIKHDSNLKGILEGINLLKNGKSPCGIWRGLHIKIWVDNIILIVNVH